jgi:hypothetical protein
MLISEISLWGTALIAILVFIASIVLFFIDRQMLRRMLAIFGATIAQMAVVGTVVWLVFTTNTWWSYLLCYLLILFLSICWVLYPLQAIWKKMVVPIGTSVLVGSIVTAGSTMLCLPNSVFMTVYSVLMACLTASMIQTMISYQHSMHNPEAHTKEMTWRESVIPQVRTMAQPLIMIMPMLYVGMLLGGVKPIPGLITLLLLIAVSFVANVLSGSIALSMIRKGKK